MENRGVSLPGLEDKNKFEAYKKNEMIQHIRFDQTMFFGLQYLLEEYLSRPITQAMVEDAKIVIDAHMKPGLFNYEGWTNLVKKHKGKLPLRIRAVAEGSVVPVGNVLLTMESTDPEFPWVASWFEALALRIWYPSAVATLSHFQKQIIYAYMLKSSDAPMGKLPFMLHDFGARGVSSSESSGIGDMAHLVNFLGTDTLMGLAYARKYYHADRLDEATGSFYMPGFSIPAAEHSTITSWGRDYEVFAYKNMLDRFATKDGDLVAMVADSYDITHAVEDLIGGVLQAQVIAAGDKGATIVIRPDSGDPVEWLPKLLGMLESKFGATRNGKGYKLINHNIRLIQGDGIDIESMPRILHAVLAAEYSAENLAFGSGGALLQKLNRDTFKTAYKTSAIFAGDTFVEVYKQPATDPSKTSKKGIQDLKLDAQGTYHTVQIPFSAVSPHDVRAPLAPDSQLQVVFENGEIKRSFTFEEVRNQAKKNFFE